MKRGDFALRHESAFLRRLLAMPLVAAVAGMCLSGCASISQKFAESASQLPAVGLPAGAPERPSQQAAYPAVHDLPPPRNSVVLTNMEVEQLEGDLAVARDRQRDSVGLAPAKKKSAAPAPAKNNKDRPLPERIDPVSSSSSIY
jgi:hypothetical protein